MTFDRGRGSHVRTDGQAKVTYAIEAEAVQAANLEWARRGQPRSAYRCTQAPEHWHTGSGPAPIRLPEAAS